MSLIHTVTILICLAAIFSYVNYRFFKLPKTIGLMIISLVLSLVIVSLGKLGLEIEYIARRFLMGIDFNEALMHGMLSCLLFAGALHINLSELLDQKWVVATLASVGVVLSTIITGSLGYYLFAVLGLDLPLLYCLLFGALIAPTDPIAVMGILKEAGLPKPLETKIVGESLFNDGVGVVVYLVLLSLLPPSSMTGQGVVMLLVQEAIGGAILGWVLGFVTYRMLQSVDDYQVEILMTLALVLGGFALGESLHMSGPIVVVVAGLFIGNHGRQWAMSDLTRERLDNFWELVDELLNAVLFVLIGLEVVILSLDLPYVSAGLLAIPIVLVARFLSVGLQIKLFSVVREFNDRTITVLTWGGLRGGISVALALSIPQGGPRNAIVTITYSVVLFSILVQGLTIGRLLRHLGLKASRP